MRRLLEFAATTVRFSPCSIAREVAKSENPLCHVELRLLPFLQYASRLHDAIKCRPTQLLRRANDTSGKRLMREQLLSSAPNFRG